nr:reverse transcriptase domain-containing protein [Tanacetum cinerariifolium]
MIGTLQSNGVNQQVKAVTPNCETCGGPHSFNDCPATVGNTQNVYAAGAYQGIKETIILKGTTKEGTNSSKELTKIPQPQVVTTNEFSNFIKANDVILKNMQTNMTSLTNSNLELQNMFGQFMKMNTASSSGLRTLPVERETEVTKDKVHPTNNGSTKYFQPLVVPTESPILNSELVISPIIEPVASPVNFNFIISFADALILMPKFGPSIKSLLTKKDKLSLNDLSSSINLMPLYVWNNLSLPDLSPTCMTLELSDRSISHPVGVAEDVFVKVGTFHFPADFVVVDFDADPRVPLIIERSFLKTERALIDMFEGELTLRVGKETITFNLDQTSRYSANYNDMMANRIDVIDMACEEYSQEVLSDDKLSVIIVKDLSVEEKTALITVLKSHKRAIAWKLSDIKGIDAEFCTHKILIEEDFEPAVQHQRRVNPKIYDVIKNEVLKLLDAGLIYPISDSPRVSPVHYVPKKGGFIVVEDKENELILTRLVTGWRVCIDYRKLNEATRKDHFPLPFMDQMLERLAENQYYCFLNSFSGYFQILIDPKDQEKTKFTCPYETFAYRRMPFRLCNAPGTFQRCMMAIFHDMIEKTMEVFMDDFSVFGNSFKPVSPI